ncbi:MAG: DUF222 domain-containing protein [Mycobacteriaceae bacterium]|nr:DUF222 domain-containing protein [Mycobacteriaceae bacterium]
MAPLEAAVADLAAEPLDELSPDALLALTARVEVCLRTLAAVSTELLAALGGRDCGALRLRDVVANTLHISAAEADTRLGAAADLAGPAAVLAHTAAAAKAGLIGAEAVRIVRDTLAKLPDTATAHDRAFFDVELAAVAVAHRPEVLRREAAKLLAGYDAICADPHTRERARAARRGLRLGPQDADGMSRGSFCLDPEARAYLEALLAKAARPGMCNPADPLPTVDADPDPVAAATDTRSSAQRNHDALKAILRVGLASGDWGHHRGLPVTAIITMTLQQLEAGAGIALTGGGSTVPIEVALRMAAHAHHYLYIYDEHSGREIFLGRSQRIASADQRIVLHAVDGGCTMPGCDQPGYNCQVHHLIEWAAGGTTDIDRLTLVCEQNHKHAGQQHRQWQARRRYDNQSLGRTLWYPPRHLDRKRRPRTNTHHRPPKTPPTRPDAP